jgi:hypothetical protein
MSNLGLLSSQDQGTGNILVDEKIYQGKPSADAETYLVSKEEDLKFIKLFSSLPTETRVTRRGPIFVFHRYLAASVLIIT